MYWIYIPVNIFCSIKGQRVNFNLCFHSLQDIGPKWLGLAINVARISKRGGRLSSKTYSQGVYAFQNEKFPEIFLDFPWDEIL